MKTPLLQTQTKNRARSALEQPHLELRQDRDHQYISCGVNLELGDLAIAFDRLGPGVRAALMAMVRMIAIAQTFSIRLMVRQGRCGTAPMP